MINVYDFHVAHPEIFTQISVNDKLFLSYQCPQIEKKLALYTHLNLIVYTLKGKRIIHHGGKTWLLSDSQSVFIGKTAFKQEIYHDTIGWQVLAFYFPDEYIVKIWDEFNRNKLAKVSAPTDDILIEINVNEITRSFFYSIVPYFKHRFGNAEDLLELKFKELLFNIFSDPQNAALTSYINSIRNEGICRIQEVMETNYLFNLSIEELSRMANCSVSTFKRKFYEHYHTTPGKWLKHKRLENAKWLLGLGNKTISDAAYDSGFENLSHFSRIFKEAYGVPPSSFKATGN